MQFFTQISNFDDFAELKHRAYTYVLITVKFGMRELT